MGRRVDSVLECLDTLRISLCVFGHILERTGIIRFNLPVCLGSSGSRAYDLPTIVLFIEQRYIKYDSPKKKERKRYIKYGYKLNLFPHKGILFAYCNFFIYIKKI